MSITLKKSLKKLRIQTLLLQVILGFLFFLNSSTSFAQNDCRCDELITYDKSADSLEIFKTINHLKVSKIKACNFESLNLEFQFYNNQLNLDRSFAILQELEDLLNSINCNDQLLYKLAYNKARYYHATNDFENLSVFAFKALNEAERLNDKEKQIKSLQEIVYLFTRINEDEKNWKYIKRAEKLILNFQNPENYPNYYSWLAYEYENKYTITERTTLLDSMLLFSKELKKGAFKEQQFSEITKYYRIQESYSYHKNDLKSALIYSDSAIYYGKKIDGVKNLSSLYLSKTWNYLDLGLLEEASIYMDTTLFYNKNRQTAASMMIYSEGAKIYEGAGKIEKAYFSFKKYSTLKDSILNLQKLEKINELEQKYHKAKNEQQIIKLEKTKQLYLFLIIGSILSTLLLIFFFRQRSLKSKQKIMQTEQRINRARINPHFFFNAMTSLQNLSQQEKSPKTTIYTSRLAKIMRQSLESTYKEVITIEQEIDFLTQYLEIQKLRYTSKFEYQFHIDDNLEINELKIPGMIIQPFVENSIEHGFKSIDYIGKINVFFKELNNQIKIIVEDNGQNSKSKEKSHKSRAMQIIRDRLYLFNKQHTSKANYQITNSENNNGFKIVISLPKIY